MHTSFVNHAQQGDRAVVSKFFSFTFFCEEEHYASSLLLGDSSLLKVRCFVRREYGG